MIKEALSYLVGLACDGQRIQTKELPNGVTLVSSPSGERTVSRRCADRRDSIYDLDSFSRIATDRSEGGDAVFVNGENSTVRYFVNLETRFEASTLKLVKSSQFEAFENLAKPQKPKDLVRVLRTKLHECVNDSSILPALSRIDFSRKSDGRHNTEHGRESFGNAIEQEVQANGAKAPEHITFDLSLFANKEFQFKGQIKCALDFDFDNERISIIPLGDQVEIFKAETMERVITRVKEAIGDSIPVYHGCTNDG